MSKLRSTKLLTLLAVVGLVVVSCTTPSKIYPYHTTVEGIYDDGSNLGEISTEFTDDEEKERFEEPGDIIDKRNIILKVSAGDAYNYQLELRNKGLVIKALDNSSVSFIESNKGLVIQSAISEVMSVVGFVKSQLKTIIIDIKERF